ncbi:unnamed protein product [Ostreobium quekettii]|uniref:Uncharacterized protein n=1 Tax=Ostreobium quekettii TaxID=121088 RepID=A0A8S1INV6_9CHLO|nr:unnamed protein product [Ostreobium quekettii]
MCKMTFIVHLGNYRSSVFDGWLYPTKAGIWTTEESITQLNGDSFSGNIVFHDFVRTLKKFRKFLIVMEEECNRQQHKESNRTCCCRTQVIFRTPGLRIIRQLLRSGQGGFTCRRDVIEGVAAVLGEDEEDLQDIGLDAHMYKRIAVQTVYELCSHGGDSMRVAGAQAGVVLSLLRILDSDPPPRMQHAVLRALHNLCRHSLPRTQLATSGGVPSLLGIVGLGMREAKWVPRQRYDTPVGRRQQTYTGPASPGHQGSGIQQDTAFHIRALEYCSAVLRIIADAQSPEWTDDLLEGGAVPTMLEALNQSASAIVKKQALGTLTSLASIRDSRAPEFIALEGGCSALMNLRVDASQSHAGQVDDADQWLAWTSLALYHLLENKHTKRYVLKAARETLDGDARGISIGMLKQLFAPCVDNVDVDWIVAL